MRADKAMKTEDVERLISSLNKLDALYANISASKNQSVGLLNPEIIITWHRLNVFYSKVEPQIDKDSIYDLLLNKYILERYVHLKKMFDLLFQSQRNEIFSLYLDCQEIDFRIENELIFGANIEDLLSHYDRYLDEGMKEDYEAYFKYVYSPDVVYNPSTEENDIYDKSYVSFKADAIGIKSLNQSLDIIYKVWTIISSFREQLYPEICKEYYYEKLEQEFRCYTIKNINKFQRSLNHETQRFKRNRSIALTPEIWGDLLHNEDIAYDLAIKGCFVDNIEKQFDAFVDADREAMESNIELLQKILDISEDGMLFDFEYAKESHINLIDTITSANVNLFLKLVLRRNLMQCEMFPHLKEKHETWLRQGLTDKYKPETGNLTTNPKYELSILPDDQRHLFMKPDKFDAYCRVLEGDIKTFIEGQGNKALWDVVNFYSMLYGFFSSKISRENVAAIFVSIIPGLGEAKSLSASMAKCSFARKDKLKKYVTLPATDELKAYEENIGKWIKEIAQSEESSQ